MKTKLLTTDNVESKYIALQYKFDQFQKDLFVLNSSLGQANIKNSKLEPFASLFNSTFANLSKSVIGLQEEVAQIQNALKSMSNDVKQLKKQSSIASHDDSKPVSFSIDSNSKPSSLKTNQTNIVPLPQSIARASINTSSHEFTDQQNKHLSPNLSTNNNSNVESV